MKNIVAALCLVACLTSIALADGIIGDGPGGNGVVRARAPTATPTPTATLEIGTLPGKGEG